MALLDTLRSSFSSRVELSKKASISQIDPLDFFRNLKESGETTHVAFETATGDGTLRVFSSGVEIILPLAEDVKEKFTDDDLYRYRGKYIGCEIPVVVVSVDAENNRVIVERKGAVDLVENELNDEIFKKLREKEASNSKEPIIVSGRVFHISEDGKRALVDIYDKHIIGVISIADWDEGYTRSLISSCRKGSYYDFEILGQNTGMKHSRRKVQWRLSRKHIAANPWENIPEDLAQEGNTVVVKCVEVPAFKSYWWGTCDRLDGVEIMGSFNTKSLRVMEGMLYKCKIRRVNSAERVYRVVPYQYAETTGGVVSLDEYIESRQKNHNTRRSIRRQEALLSKEVTSQTDGAAQDVKLEEMDVTTEVAKTSEALTAQEA